MSLERPTRPGYLSTYQTDRMSNKDLRRGKRRSSQATNQTNKLKHLYEMYLLGSFGRKIITEHPPAGLIVFFLSDSSVDWFDIS